MVSSEPLSLLSRLQWFGRILLACRVSVISAIAGVLLFSLVPQARDLFSDITYGALPSSLAAGVKKSAFHASQLSPAGVPPHIFSDPSGQGLSR